MYFERYVEGRQRYSDNGISYYFLQLYRADAYHK